MKGLFKSKAPNGAQETAQEENKEDEVEMADQKDEGKSGLGEMKRGDYLVHIFIEKIKEISCKGTDEGGTVDPIVQCSWMQQQEYSSAKDDIGGLGEVVYNEHVFLESNNVEKDDAKKAKITLKLMDKGLFKETMIGMFDFDMSYIYFMKGQLLSHQWLALSNPNSDEHSKITAYMKVSIAVTCTGDEPVEIKIDDSGHENGNIMMPPSLNPKFYQIKVRIVQAQQLPPMDMKVAYVRAAKIDAYFMTTYKSKKLKTRVEVMEEGGPPIDFNQEIWIPAQVPVLDDYLIIKLMDDDTAMDECAGSIAIDMKNLLDEDNLKNPQGKFVWKNIYGSPLNQYPSKYKDQMNEEPDVASNWKGRVLMQISCEKCKKPVAKVQNIDKRNYTEEEKYNSSAALRPKSFQIIAEIGQAVALPKANNKYTIKMIVGGHELQTNEPAYVKNNYNRFNQRFDSKIIQVPYVDVYDFGKVIILLMDDGNPVCYHTENVKNFMDENAQWRWISLLPDRCVGKVTCPNEAGLISFKMSINQIEEGKKPINYQSLASWKKKSSKEKEMHNVIIRAYIYQCRDLPAADSNGTSDPYLQVWDMSDQPKKTQIQDDNTNPLFYETIEMEYEVRDINDPESYPPFILDVYDHDDELLDSSPDFLGRAMIEPEDENCVLVFEKDFKKNQELEIPIKPTWHPIIYQEGDPACGQILVSFAICSKEYVWQCPAPQVDLSSRVERKDFNVNLLVLGLRQLESPGIFPVQKAFIQFNIKSLVSASDCSVSNIKTQPGAKGANPTLNTSIKFQIPLPVDPHYCPKLSCFVYDNIARGFSQPMIGVFTIPIGDLMISLQQERDQELLEIENVCQKLEEILQNPDFQPKSYALHQTKSVNSQSQLVEEMKQQTELYPNSQVDSGSGVVTEIADQSEEEFQHDGSIVVSDNDSLIESALNDSFTKVRRQSSRIRSSIASRVRKISRAESAANKQVKKIKEIQRSMSRASERDGSVHLGANAQDSNHKAFLVKEELLKKLKKQEQTLIRGQDNVLRESGAAIFGEDNADPPKQQLSKKEQQKQYDEIKQQQKRLEEEERNIARKVMAEQGDKAAKFVLYPTYKLCDRLKVHKEIDPPNDSLYMPLGWDENEKTGRKHYRQFYNDELENNKEIFPQSSPFNSFELKRGQSRGIKKGGLFHALKPTKQDASGQVSTEQVVGFFKGIIEIESEEGQVIYAKQKKEVIDKLIGKLKSIAEVKLKPEEKDEMLPRIDPEKMGSVEERRAFKALMRHLNVSHLQVTKHLTNLKSDDILKKQLRVKVNCVIRIYMIEAINLSMRDIGSPSDPYLYISCNEKIYNERDSYQVDQPNPKFHKYFDFTGTFPGSSPLKIDVYDYDDIFGDDLIGSTSIDLEDRWFTMDWNILHDKPIEYRQIYHKSSTRDQGLLKLWLEINQISKKTEKPYDITPRPPQEFEVRVCVFNCKDMKMMDIEGTSDVYFRGFFDANEDQETDTHFRNSDGKPDFQYRLVYRLKLPKDHYKFSLQAYDRDFFKSNDMIGEACIDLKNLLEDCQYVKKPMGLNKKYYNDVLKNQEGFQPLEFDEKDDSRFWLKIRSKNKDGEIEDNGKVMVQIDVMPADVANKAPVGKAREQPNHSPNLPEPKGRLELANPFKMFMQMVSPEIRRKIIIFLCLVISAILLVSILPNIMGSVIATAIAAAFHCV